MSVAFPTGFYLTKDSDVSSSANVRHTVMDDGSLRTQELGSAVYDTIRCVLPFVSQSDYQTFRTFFVTNRAEDITMTLDGLSYIGRITSDLRTRKQGSWYRIEFDYYATTV